MMEEKFCSDCFEQEKKNLLQCFLKSYLDKRVRETGTPFSTPSAAKCIHTLRISLLVHELLGNDEGSAWSWGWFTKDDLSPAQD